MPLTASSTFERVADGLHRLDVAAGEWAGLVAYRLTGRSDALFSGPYAKPPSLQVERR